MGLFLAFSVQRPVFGNGTVSEPLRFKFQPGQGIRPPRIDREIGSFNGTDPRLAKRTNRVEIESEMGGRKRVQIAKAHAQQTGRRAQPASVLGVCRMQIVFLQMHKGACQ